jgi:hypothetical protein
MREANRLAVTYAVIVGEDEFAANHATVKNLANANSKPYRFDQVVAVSETSLRRRQRCDCCVHKQASSQRVKKSTKRRSSKNHLRPVHIGPKRSSALKETRCCWKASAICEKRCKPLVRTHRSRSSIPAASKKIFAFNAHSRCRIVPDSALKPGDKQRFCRFFCD